MRQCKKCKCNRCGNLHTCEVILDKIIEMDVNGSECRPVIECKTFNPSRNNDIYNHWNCQVRKVKGGDNCDIRTK